MISEKINALKNHLQTALDDEVYIGNYKGEFEEGAEWNPVFPCILLELTDYAIKLRDGKGEILKGEILLNIYGANKDDVIDLFEEVIPLLDNKFIIYKDEEENVTKINTEITEMRFFWRKIVQIFVIVVKIY